MAVLVLIVVIAAVVGAVVWNHRNAAAAQVGVQFPVGVPPAAVEQVLHSVLCSGAKAKATSMLTGVRVQPARGGFQYGTKYGDEGSILLSSSEGGTSVAASTSKLFVGSPLKLRPKSGIYAFSAAMTRRMYVLCGITPGAVKMKRFQNRLEAKIVRQLARAAEPS